MQRHRSARVSVSMCCRTAALSLLLIAWLAPTAGASYVVVDLNGSILSAMGVGVANGVQIGQGGVAGYGHALSWQGSAGTLIDLTPLGYDTAGTLGIGGGQIVGNGSGPSTTQNHSQALLWNTRSSNAINLNKSSISVVSTAWATDGTYQVGSGELTNYTGALMWNGSGDSCVNLNPSGFTDSEAHGVYGGYQVGWGSGDSTGSKTHALMWHGSATQYWDINPAGKNNSYINGMVGMQAFGSADAHAMLWSLNTDGTFTNTDLQPASGFISTEINGSNGTQQVGNAVGSATGNLWHAMLWNGSSSSWLDLHQFLPTGPGYVRSGAYGIDANGDVVGWAADGSGFNRAILWQVPEPATLSLLALGGLALLRRCRGFKG